MAHPRLVTFFEGAVDELRAAYKKSERAPSAAKGSTRENAIVTALHHLMPPVAIIHHGEVIDRHGRQSGQLDGIVRHATGVALATTPHEAPVALAEGVLAVIEAKSDLSKQWTEVKGTWSKLSKLRRAGTRLHYKSFSTPPETGIPFIAIGRKGWSTESKIVEKTTELFSDYGEDKCPTVMVAQLDPAAYCLVRFSKSKGSTAVVSILDKDEHWQSLAAVWGILVNEAHGALKRQIDWTGYMG